MYLIRIYGVYLSLSQQVIPTEWKCHAISPIHKSGN